MFVDGVAVEGEFATGFELVRAVGGGAEIIALEHGGQLYDLSATLVGVNEVRTVAAASKAGRSILRHSAAHIMAQAVVDCFPGTKYAIGPSTEEGFFYDFQLPGGARFDLAELAVIEERMRSIIGERQPFIRQEVGYNEAERIFFDQPYKLEIISRVRGAGGTEDDLREAGGTEMVSIYRNSERFVDLCRGPHVPDTGYVKAVKLLRTSGAYWRGSEANDQLQRIYGTAFWSEGELEAYLVRMREAEKRDHRKLGAELDWFHFPPEVGGGLPVFHPKGAYVRYRMEEFSRKQHLAFGYQLAWTPHIAKAALFERSGHLGWYRDGMFPPMEMEGSTYYPKPMNCPFHILIFESQPRSYRDLPLRLFEFGTVYRYERSGTLHGLARVRGLTQDDSHIFCTPGQLADELARLLEFVLSLLRAFGLEEFAAELATRPDKAVGSEEDWEFATAAARSALEKTGLEYTVAAGEGAFYAPKIDIHLTDAIGRRWQVSTLQIDLQLPQRFELEYQSPENTKERPFMIHRALFGSVERFLAILIEHYEGHLPAWLLDEQVRLLPVNDASAGYAQEIAGKLVAAGARVTVSGAGEPLGARVRKAKIDRVPYLAVVGPQDLANGTVGLTRPRSPEQRGFPLSSFLEEVAEAIREPQLQLEIGQ